MAGNRRHHQSGHITSSATGTASAGVVLSAGRTVTNQGKAALIAGGNFGVNAKTIAATVINDGTITASGTGVYPLPAVR